MEQGKKKVSIIIPCYNVERYLDRCVNSLVNQTIGVDALQLIFVDDASTDRTGRKLSWWQKKYPESIEVCTLPANRRQGGARNEGLRHVKGETIGFVDSDDWVAPEMFQILYETLQREQCDFVNCFAKRAMDTNVMLNAKVCEGKRFDITDEKARREHIIEKLPGGNPCRLFRREFLLQAAPPFPEHTAYEDNYWMAMVKLATGSWYLVGQELYYYFVNMQSTVMSADSDRHRERLQVEESKLAEYKRRGLFEKYYREIEFEFLRLYYINSLHTFFVRMTDLKGLPFDEMRKTVCKEFPDYRNNPYMERFLPIERELLKTLECEISDGQWELLRNTYVTAIGGNV